MIFVIQLGEPPVIDEGIFVPQPPNIISDNKRVKIGTPVYVVNGFNVTIDCGIIRGESPITISWLHNGVPDPSRGNVSTITITDASDGDVFTCRANNSIDFDVEKTTINVFSK